MNSISFRNLHQRHANIRTHSCIDSRDLITCILVLQFDRLLHMKHDLPEYSLTNVFSGPHPPISPVQTPGPDAMLCSEKESFPIRAHG